MSYDPNNRDPDLLSTMDELEGDYSHDGYVLARLNKIRTLLDQRGLPENEPARLELEKLRGLVIARQTKLRGELIRLRTPED